MYNLKIYKQVGLFRDDFFIDYIDTEYCLRIRQQGFNIIVACELSSITSLVIRKRSSLVQ